MCPNITVEIDGFGKIVLNDSMYLAEGGEGKVYAKKDIAYKIYHDPSKMIPENKIKELAVLTPEKKIINPLSIIRDPKNGKPLGYTSVFIPKASPLCKLFPKAYWLANSYQMDDAVYLVEKIQKTVTKIHPHNILIVDFNEMNIIVDEKNNEPYFIDVDSYQTPSYQATAIMESIRDPQIVNNQFNKLSDWFSFGILAFQIYVGIHPYKGTHPDYLPKEWLQRMKDGVSCLDPKSKLPPACRPFDSIPKSHMRWFEDLFIKNIRTEPPLPGDIVLVTNVPTKVLQQMGKFTTNIVGTYVEEIKNLWNYKNENFVLTRSKLFMTSRGTTSIWNYKPKKYDKILIIDSPSTYPYRCTLENGELIITELVTEKVIAQTQANDIMERDGRLYSIFSEKIYEYRFIEVSNKNVMHSTRIVGGCMMNATKVFDGTIFQDMIGQPAFTIPYDKGSAYFNIIKELRGYRVIDAKSERNVLVVMAEKNGVYDKFIFIFDKTYTSYNFRKVENITLEAINFTKIENGPCIMSASDKVELFVNNVNVNEFKDPPFDSSDKLFNIFGKVYYVEGKNIISVSMK